MPFGQTIAVIDKSGKMVSTSKQLFGVFNHAKDAYRERKSAYQSERNAKIAEQQLLEQLERYQIDDAPSAAGSRRSRGTRSRHHSGRSRAPSQYGDGRTVVSRRDSQYEPPQTIARRHTHHDVTVRDAPRPSTARIIPIHPQEPNNDQKELDGLVHRAQWLLEEAHCVQHGATATIAHLQKNPDAMAAVALTLAEISNIARKMAPTALTALKSASPAVFALLSSPQFLIAAGVGLGVTVVMFGGYRIIKRIQGNDTEAPNPQQPQPEMEMEDMMELNAEALSSVDMWRRGVADVQAESLGTSVDGEFITPTAAAMSGIDVTTARARRDPRFKFEDDGSVASSRRSRRSRSSRAPTHTPSERHSERRSRAPPSEAPTGFFSRPSRSKAPSKAPTKAPTKASSQNPRRASSKAGTYISESEKPPKSKEKKKGPSRLRLMFTS
ncbi:hypothetical protein N7499_011988 [Penicillium canescens]|nr:hypothetical protein N7499_011988 [Penicillium canescens]